MEDECDTDHGDALRHHKLPLLSAFLSAMFQTAVDMANGVRLSEAWTAERRRSLGLRVFR